MRMYLALLFLTIFPLNAVAQMTEIGVKTITVLADRALAVPLSKIASNYSREHNVSITVAYAPSFEQALTIQEGGAADLFISANPKSLAQLKQRGLFDTTSVTPIIRANIALVTRADNSLDVTNLGFTDILSKRADYIAIASPAATAEGYYSQQVLKHTKTANAPVAEMADTENIFYQLSQDADSSAFALVFEPDARQQTHFRTLAVAPPDMHETAIFIAAVVPGQNMELARTFKHYLLSDKAQKIFTQSRFYSLQ